MSLIAGSLLVRDNKYLLESVVTSQVGIQNYYLSFSRDQEREADYYGVETLDKLNLSKEPLLKFLNLLEKKSFQKGFVEEYHKFSTHPIFEERYKFINNSSKSLNFKFDETFNNRFNFIKAKIFGYTENNINILEKNLQGYYQIYAKSIVFSKKGDLKKSMQLLNLLIKNNPENKFILETKGDILYSNGYLSESLLFYEKVKKDYPLNNYIKTRIFDIKFKTTDFKENDISKSLFNDYSHLLLTFYNSNDLNHKFHKLAKNCNFKNWLKYFSLLEKFYNKQLDKKDFKENLVFISNNTSDKVLKKLVNIYISNINENT